MYCTVSGTSATASQEASKNMRQLSIHLILMGLLAKKYSYTSLKIGGGEKNRKGAETGTVLNSRGPSVSVLWVGQSFNSEAERW